MRRADHANEGLILDSFHTLARKIDPDSIGRILVDHIFFVQLADAPAIPMDLLYWSRHLRNMSGEGDGDVLALARAVMGGPSRAVRSGCDQHFNAAPFKRLSVPILLQASNDEAAKVDVKSRRDAFCGKISVTNNFWQYGIPFSETTNHTSDVWGDEFGGDLDRFTRVCRTVRGLRRARLGAFGAREPGRFRPCGTAKSCCRRRA